MNLWILKPGHRIRMRDGSEAEVLSETEDGEHIRVRSTELTDDSSRSGNGNLVSAGEVEALLGIAVNSSWGEKVTVLVHHRPEDEDFGGGYEAATMAGVPYNVIVTADDDDSVQGALRQLLDGLRAFGFRGRVAVEDATGLGGVERYEIEVI